ncbi:MAG: aminopeptidase [Eubacteriales bacterium]|nr:aminopeptidase [Eubacteriales bacterium]
MDRNILKNYARYIAFKGINVKKGQRVIIRTAPEQLDFVEMLVEQCYIAGASKVSLEWRFDPALRLDIAYQDIDELSSLDIWEIERWKEKSLQLPANIYLDSDDPDALTGIDTDKWAKAQQKRFSITKEYRDKMENRYQWCVAAVPGLKWAKKVFPGISDGEAIEKLWEAIIRCSRADVDPMLQWAEHNADIHTKCDRLNSLGLRTLKYKSVSTGTDLSVGLMPQMRFMGGSELLADGVTEFNANIPSEEIFTTPMRGEADGIVYATRPLCYRGVMIDGFYLRFEKGRVVECHADRNEDALKTMLAMDEGASMLGECALVPYSSPIRESGILFYNTLFDENASCHLALGDGYSSCLEDFQNYTPEQARALGVNESMIHEDFMIGSDDLEIVGITEDGREIRIFTDGEWDKEL